MQLHPLFTDHMVLPADIPFRFFGSGSGDVTVAINGERFTTHSDTVDWQITLPPMPCGGPYTVEVTFSDRTVRLQDVYIGRVYLLAGQSNAQMKLRETNYPTERYTDNDRVRMFCTKRVEVEDVFNPADGWQTCKRDDAGNWSALAYLIGAYLTEKTDEAVGIITCYQGASVIESWVPKGAFTARGITLADSQKFIDHFAPAFQKWNADGVLYNFGLSQIVPFALNGVVWYQGESDCSLEEARVYEQELGILIDIWRQDFMDPALPFTVVQIADNVGRAGEAWARLQQAQWDIQFSRAAVKTVKSADVCEDNNIHPPTKHLLAQRIADVLIKM